MAADFEVAGEAVEPVADGDRGAARPMSVATIWSAADSAAEPVDCSIVAAAACTRSASRSPPVRASRSRHKSARSMIALAATLLRPRCARDRLGGRVVRRRSAARFDVGGDRTGPAEKQVGRGLAAGLDVDWSRAEDRPPLARISISAATVLARPNGRRLRCSRRIDGEGIGARDQRLLQPRDTAVEMRWCGRCRVHRRTVESGRPRRARRRRAPTRRGPRSVVATAGDDAVDLVDPPVEGGDDFLAAVADALAHFGDARRPCGADRLRARIQRFLKARPAGSPASRPSRAISRRSARRSRRDRLFIVSLMSVRPLADPLDQIAAIGLHRAIEFGKVARDQAPSGRRITSDPLGELAAVRFEHLLEGLEPLGEHVADEVAARTDPFDQVAAAAREHSLERLQTLRQHVAHRIGARHQAGRSVRSCRWRERCRRSQGARPSRSYASSPRAPSRSASSAVPLR